MVESDMAEIGVGRFSLPEFNGLLMIDQAHTDDLNTIFFHVRSVVLLLESLGYKIESPEEPFKKLEL